MPDVIAPLIIASLLYVDGLLVPIPTLPLESIRIRSTELVTNCINCKEALPEM